MSESPTSAPAHRGKVVVVGDYACGKTCLVQRLVHGAFFDKTLPTVASAYANKVLDLTGEAARGGPPAVASRVVPVLPGQSQASVERLARVGISAAALPPAAGSSAPGSPSSTAARAASVPADAGTQPQGDGSPLASASAGGTAQSELGSTATSGSAATAAPNLGSVKLELWDTAGSEQFASLMPMYFRDALAALVIFDVTNRDSAARVAQWAQRYREHNEDAASQLCTVIVATKCDLIGDAAFRANSDADFVDETEMLRLATSLNAPLYCTSAKTGANVEACFRGVARHVRAVSEDRQASLRRQQSGLGLGHLLGLRSVGSTATAGSNPGHVPGGLVPVAGGGTEALTLDDGSLKRSESARRRGKCCS